MGETAHKPCPSCGSPNVRTFVDDWGITVSLCEWCGHKREWFKFDKADAKEVRRG